MEWKFQNIAANPETGDPLKFSHGWPILLGGEIPQRGASLKIDLSSAVNPGPRRPAHTVPRSATPADLVEILRTRLGSIAEIRKQRVDILREAILNHTFSVSPALIADRILAEWSVLGDLVRSGGDTLLRL